MMNNTFAEYLAYCKSYGIDITKWSSADIHEKTNSKKSLTEAETCALLFFQEMHKWFK